MKILSLNPGSTSLKSALFETEKIIQKIHHIENSICLDEHIQEYKKLKYITNKEDIDAFGVRVVHGGAYFQNTVKINDETFKKLEKLSELAPLHIPPALELIEKLQQYSTKPIYAIFDTTFHTSIPDYISHYPISQKIEKKFHIKKYGFHGIAMQSILHQYKKSDIKNKKIIACHLGGGCSITAIKDGKSLNNSMGFTPLDGVMMVKRSGTINAGAFVYLRKKLKMNDEECLDFLNNQAGFIGYTGKSDIKKIFENAEKQRNKKDEEAVSLFVHRICEYIWNYYGLLNGCDEIVFSGGIGRNNSFARKKICEKLAIFGVQLDEEKNLQIMKRNCETISCQTSAIKIRVIHTDETQEIAREIEKINTK